MKAYLAQIRILVELIPRDKNRSGRCLFGHLEEKQSFTETWAASYNRQARGERECRIHATLLTPRVVFGKGYSGPLNNF
jgi:hypothetical protein